MRGDKRKYEYNAEGDNTTGENVMWVDHYILSDVVIWQINGFYCSFQHKSQGVLSIYASKLESENSGYRKNILSILQANWIMVTVILRM
jgi:hypothetical protein